ncbi:MAG TPA: phosphate ABC transporter permease subunit PstC [Prolixibacteraceae bacterium]|nr:phosphate ABC transporter permease subunit PstC [Prolixibacteraceae bacterium]
MNSETGLIDITRKKFRWSDYLAEKMIKGVAFLSITIIALIFFFVFREALPIFGAGKSKPKTEVSSSSELVQETYGEVTDNSHNGEVQETYGEVTDPANSTETQETYGEVVDTTAQKSADEKKYTVSSGSGADENRAALQTIIGKEWVPVSEKPRYGIIALIIGTFKITIISILFSAPVAILAALYTASFAGKRMKEFIKPAIELLAGFPSVVIGFFALMVLATFLQNIFQYDTRLNAFVGGIAMGIAAIPIIFTITEDALTAVPKTYYEASLALGASKWQTAFFVILPAATPGIFAAILLGIGRVFGETMIALMATGNAPLMGANPFESVRTLAATIGAEMAEVVFGDTHYNVLFLIGSLLFVFTFAINAIAEFYVKGKLMKKIQGK